MDRNFILAIILSTLVIILFASPVYQNLFGTGTVPTVEQPAPGVPAPALPSAPTAIVRPDTATALEPSASRTGTADSVLVGEIVQENPPAAAEPVVIANGDVKVTIQPRGASIVRVLLPPFDGPAKGEPVQLVKEGYSWYDCSITTGNQAVDCNAFTFALERTDSTRVVARAALSGGRTITRTFELNESGFGLHVETELGGPWADPMLNFSWHGPIDQTERAIRQIRIWPFSLMMPDVTTTFQKLAYIGQGDRVTTQPTGATKTHRVYLAENVQKLEPNKAGQWRDRFTGDLGWFALRNKYFMCAAVPDESMRWETTAAYSQMSDKERWFEFILSKPADGDTGLDIFLGPMKYDILEVHGRELPRAMELSFRYIRPLSILFLWIIKKIQVVVPNWGLVIIIFSLLIKLVLYPLSKSSFDSMHKMSKLQPQIAALRGKHKDPQRLQQATMELYKREKVNPFGGCLPMLLQMPVFFALYPVMDRAFELRQAMFIPGWIDDLSRPDPFYILPVAMGVSMFFQSKSTMTDPQQKPMLYMMPIMMVILFANFSAGLTLYWFLFNIFSYLQQTLHTKT